MINGQEMNYNSVKELIVSGELSVDNMFIIFTWLNGAIETGSSEEEAREILLRLLDKKASLPQQIQPVLNDYVEKMGYYPYLDIDESVSTKTLLHYEFYRSENIPHIVMHQKQAEIYDAISNRESIILSAPTSFGKSLLIEEIVASREYSNIVILLPTLALIDETRQKLFSYTGTYKLIFTSKQTVGDKNVFILTAERLLEIEDLPKVDFFIIDEFYKLDGNRDEDERLNVLNHAFYKLIKMTRNFYLLGPNIASIPSGFEEEYDCRFVPSEFATVACDEVFIKREKKRVIDQLVELLKTLPEPTMIYCKSPGSAESTVRKYLDKIKYELEPNELHEDAINWIKKHIHPDWLLIEALKYGIAFHHGAMPRHIGRYIIDGFNEGTIKYLFCTSTLIEGINTAAKNVVLFDDKKGKDTISYFDYRNIKGRAGRMIKHFVGRVYSFYSPPSDSSVEVDIPWYTQEKASDEILIQVDEEDLKPASKEKMLPYKEQVILDLDILKKNNNIPVKGQIELAKEILSDLDYYHEKLAWTNYPTYEQLETSCTLVYDYLRFSNTRDEIYSGNQLAFYVNNYVRYQSNMARFILFFLIKDSKIKTADQAVQKVIKISKNWFEFRFPKLLLGLQEIQESIFKSHGRSYGDYKFYSSIIESAFCSPVLANLQEFGLPISLLKQIEPYLDLKKAGSQDEKELDEVISDIKRMDIEILQLDPFERKLLFDFINS